MNVIKSFFIAFSMYSKVPVPQFGWKQENMKYVLCFFPCVGVLIGFFMAGWHWLCEACHVGDTAYILAGAAIPALVTGGIHIDGFMDTMDALHSYGDREKKLAILKDPHIGSFSVVMLLLYYMVYVAAFSEIRDWDTLIAVGIGFVLSRIWSAIGVTVFCPAKTEGMVRMLVDSAEKKRVLCFLLAEMAVCVAGILKASAHAALPILVGTLLCFVYYRHLCYKEFGGVTGDTSGFFLLVCEMVIVAAAALSVHL